MAREGGERREGGGPGSNEDRASRSREGLSGAAGVRGEGELTLGFNHVDQYQHHMTAVRNADSQALPPTCWIRMCTLTRSPGNLDALYSVRSLVWGIGGQTTPMRPPLTCVNPAHHLTFVIKFMYCLQLLSLYSG